MMKLYELTTTAIIVLGIVASVYVFFWGTAETEQACAGVCVFCKDMDVTCHPDLHNEDELYEEGIIRNEFEDEL
jgi:hypothetical protein